MSRFTCRADEEMPTAPDGRELVAHGTTAFPAACFDVPLDIVRIMPHWHNDFEVLTVCSGSCAVRLGSEVYRMGPGDAFFINAGALHGMYPVSGEEPGRFHSIVFSPRLVAGGLESVFWEKYIGPLAADGTFRGGCMDGSSSWHAEAADKICRAWDACEKEEPAYEFVVREALASVLAQIGLGHRRRPPRQTARDLRNEERAKAMMQYVHDNYQKEISLADVCAHAAVSQSECLRCFRSTIGTTPMQYVKEYRLTKASALLVDTDLPAGEIGARCGFADAGYFSKSFRVWSGLTPSEYRQQKRSEQEP